MCDSTLTSKLSLFEFTNIWNKWSYCTENALTFQSKMKKQLMAEMLFKYAINLRCINTHCKHCQQ